MRLKGRGTNPRGRAHAVTGGYADQFGKPKKKKKKGQSAPSKTKGSKRSKGSQVVLKARCEECGARLKSEARLIRHLQRVHGRGTQRIPARPERTLFAVRVGVGAVWHAGYETKPWVARTLCGREGSVGEGQAVRDVDCHICVQAMPDTPAGLKATRSRPGSPSGAVPKPFRKRKAR